MRVSIGDANAGVRGKVPLIQRRSTGERVSAVPMMMSSTSGAGYASTARGSRLAGAGGAPAATGLLLAALWIGLAVREHVAPDSDLRVFAVPLSAVPPPEPEPRSSRPTGAGPSAGAGQQGYVP